MSVAVSTLGLRGKLGVGVATVRRRAEAMLRALDLTQAELSVVLCSDVVIAELNRSYRRKSVPTDVLAFPMAPAPDQRGALLLGDVVISIETAERQAGPGRAGLTTEVTRLLAHGLLHLVGLDHHTARDRRRMETVTQSLVETATGRAAAGRATQPRRAVPSRPRRPTGA